MCKIAFLGAGSSVFVKNVLGDCMLTPSLDGAEFALHDIDRERLSDSEKLLKNLKTNLGKNVTINSYDNRKDALKDAQYVINAIYVGARERIFFDDFDIPKKYGLHQTIGDTVGIGGIMRGLRTIPVLLDFAEDMRQLCPDAWFLNYTNPMAILTGAMLKHTGIKTVGLCHSVQSAVPNLLKRVGMEDKIGTVSCKIAGINHMSWLLEISEEGKDLYPEIKRRAAEKQKEKHDDMARFELMLRFGHYVSESSNHHPEYYPYFIKKNYPDLIEKYNFSLDKHQQNYLGRMEKWKERRQEIINGKDMQHKQSNEYASRIINSLKTGEPSEISGNVLNTGRLIGNLPPAACVEVPCLVNKSGINPCFVGDLPEQLAALNRSNINTQLMTIKAAIERKREYMYHAAMLDPHTSAELSMDDIVSMCDELIEANEGWVFLD